MTLGAPGRAPTATSPVPECFRTTHAIRRLPSNIPGIPNSDRDAAALGLFFDSGVEKHDDEDEQHHDGPGIDDDLHGGDELSAQQQVFAGEGGHHRDQRQRGY